MANTRRSNRSKNDSNLEGKTRAELEQMAKDVPGIAQSKMTKDELIRAIQKNGKSSK